MLVILTVGQLNLNAQTLHDSQWSVRPRFTSNNFLITGVGNSLMDLIGKPHKYMPQFVSMFNVGVNIDNPAGGMVFKSETFWKRAFLGGLVETPKQNYRAGLEIMYQKRTFPIAIYVNCDYMYDKYIMREIYETEFSKYIRQGISGTFGNRVFIGSIYRIIRPIIDAGVTYNYYFDYKGSYENSLDVINNGFSFIVGTGVELQEARMCIILKYERQCYDFFNNEFTPDGGLTFPYKDYTSRFGAISFIWTWNL